MFTVVYRSLCTRREVTKSEDADADQ